MHEVSVAQSIVSLVLEKAQEMDAKAVTEVTISIGELSMISTEQIVFWVDAFFKDSCGEGARIKIEAVPGKVRCNSCNKISNVAIVEDPETHFTLPVFRCRHCDSDDTSICEGREMRVEKIRVEQ